MELTCYADLQAYVDEWHVEGDFFEETVADLVGGGLAPCHRPRLAALYSRLGVSGRPVVQRCRRQSARRSID